MQEIPDGWHAKLFTSDVRVNDIWQLRVFLHEETNEWFFEIWDGEICDAVRDRPDKKSQPYFRGNPVTFEDMGYKSETSYPTLTSACKAAEEFASTLQRGTWKLPVGHMLRPKEPAPPTGRTFRGQPID